MRSRPQVWRGGWRNLCWCLITRKRWRERDKDPRMGHFLSPRYSPCPWIVVIIPISKKRKARDNLSRVIQAWIWIPELGFYPNWFSVCFCTSHSCPLSVNPGAAVYGVYVKMRQGHLQAFCSSAKLTALSSQPDFAGESIHGLKALMALIFKASKDVSGIRVTLTHQHPSVWRSCWLRKWIQVVA